MGELIKTPGAISDGLDGEDADDVRNSLIKGSKLKFKDGDWFVGKHNEPFDTNRELTLARIFKFLQKWLPDQNAPESRDFRRQGTSARRRGAQQASAEIRMA